MKRMRFLPRSRPNGILVDQPVHQYWLASANELKRMLASDDVAADKSWFRATRRVRWKLVADVASDALRVARRCAEGIASRSTDPVRVASSCRLTTDEHMLVESLFSVSQGICADVGTDLINGRHRSRAVVAAGASFVPVVSAAMSLWPFSQRDGNSGRDALITYSALCDLYGRCRMWRAERDEPFVDAVRRAESEAFDLLDPGLET